MDAKPNHFKFTEPFIQGLSLHRKPVFDDAGNIQYVEFKGKEYSLIDTQIPGLVIRVFDTKNTYYFIKSFAGSLIRMKIGTTNEIKLNQASVKAKLFLEDISKGINPALQKLERIKHYKNLGDVKANTFAKVFENYQEARLDSPKFTLKDIIQLHKALKGSKLWGTPFLEIDKEVVGEFFHPWQVAKKYTTCHKFFRMCRAAWNEEAKDQEYKGRNPFNHWIENAKLPETNRRTNYLDMDRRADKIWLKDVAESRSHPNLFDRVSADYVLLTLIWGTRRSEGRYLELVNLDWEIDAIVFPDTKNKKDHWIPMTPGVKSLLLHRLKDNETHGIKDQNGKYAKTFVFAAPREHRNIPIDDPETVIKRANEKSGLHIQMHDLRRTMAGEMALEDDFMKVKIAMNHSEAKKDMTTTYIMVKPKLKMLRPLYEKRERYIFELAGIPFTDEMNALIAQPALPADEQMLATLKALQDNPDMMRAVTMMMNGAAKSK